MRLGLVPVVASVLLVGCAGRQRGAAASGPSFTRGKYALRVVSAMIDPVRDDSTPWHVTKPDQTPALVGAVIGLAAGQPEVGMAVGNAIADHRGNPLPPLPALRVRVSGGSWRTIASAEATYSPTWDQWIEIDASAMTGDEIVMIQVVDAIDGGMIAYVARTLAELVAQERQTLQPTGQASHFEVETRLMPEGDGADESSRREMSEGL